MATPERGLKDHEIAQLVNAIRDNVVPICASQQLRARIESALTSKLREMGLRLDDRSGKQRCEWCDDSHRVGACPRFPGE